MQFRIFLAAAVSLAATVMGAGATPAHAQMKKQLAVVPFKATPDIKQMAELCNVAARDEASKNSAVGMVDNTEIAARLDLEGKNVAGCSDDAECIIANGEALGVDGVLYGSLGKEADLVSVTVKLYLVKEKREDRTFQAKLAGEPPDIAALVARATLALITGAPLPEVSAAPPPPPQDRIITASNPGPGIAPADHQVSQQAPPPAGKGRLWTWVAMGGEGAFLALGVTFHVLAYKTDEGIKAGGKSREELDSAISSGNTQILLSRIFYGLAVAGAGATVFLFYWEGEPTAKDASSRLFKKLEPQFGVTPDGAGYLGLGGTF